MARVRWWGTGLVALALLVLAAGLPLLDKALGSGAKPLAPGTVLSVGAKRDGVRPVTFTVPSAGWVLDQADSSLTSNVELANSGVGLYVRVVGPWHRWMPGSCGTASAGSSPPAGTRGCAPSPSRSRPRTA